MKQAEMIGEDQGAIYLNSFRFLTKYFFIWHTFCICYYMTAVTM